jgi:hypothetical protein
MKKIIHICLVSKYDNALIIKQNISNFTKIYPKLIFKFYIICPQEDFFYFRKIFGKNDGIKIISEVSIIELKNFKNIFLSYFDKSKKKILTRVNWYYQQCLKISFLFLTNNSLNILWDADTIILKKINFFDNKFKVSKNYENLYELHMPYFITSKIILKNIPKKFNSAINQFASITKKELNMFANELNKFSIKKKKTSHWVAHIIAKSIYESGQSGGSLFSEYELINIWKRKQSLYKFSYIKFFRNGTNLELTKNKIELIKFLNYKHVTYENHFKNYKTKISWFALIIQLIFFETRTIKNFFKNKIKIKFQI